MKLLCDVCENAVASVVCCADEAALCSSCDARVHAANKLASKHHRVPLLSETSEPALCDICQEKPSFFFCVEDRALLCRECDMSIHSVNALAAKHRRFLLTGIKVGMNPAGSISSETSSGITLEHHFSANSPAENIDLALKKSGAQMTVPELGNWSKVDGGFGSAPKSKKVPLSPQRASNPAAAPIEGKTLGSYTMTKNGTLCIASKTTATNKRKAALADTRPNTTTISIQRISAGQQAPFVAPVLSSIRASFLQEEALTNNNNLKSNSNSDKKKGHLNQYSKNSAMMDVDGSSLPAGNDSDADYLNSGIPGWRLDELLTDLVGVCDSGRPLSPPKEINEPGFGIQEEQPWFEELDFLAEHELSPSQEEGVALVPEMPSPPTNSGLVTSRRKLTCPAAQPWAFNYLFTGPDHLHEFSVVPDIGGHKSSPISPRASPTTGGGSVSKKRKFWLHG